MALAGKSPPPAGSLAAFSHALAEAGAPFLMRPLDPHVMDIFIWAKHREAASLAVARACRAGQAAEVYSTWLPWIVRLSVVGYDPFTDDIRWAVQI